MSITVLFFGELSEAMPESKMLVDIPNPLPIGSLFINLMKDYNSIGDKWENYIMYAVNQTVVQKNYVVNDGDEVAFMPPMSGG